MKTVRVRAATHSRLHWRRLARHRNLVAHFWWRKKTAQPLPADQGGADVGDVEGGIQSLDEHLFARYTAKGLDPIRLSDRPARPEFTPEGPPPQRPLAAHIEAPDSGALASADRFQSIAPLDPSPDVTVHAPAPAPAHAAQPPTVARESAVSDARGQYVVGVAPPPPQLATPDAGGALSAFQAYCVVAVGLLGAIRLGRTSAALDARDAERSAWRAIEERERENELRRRRAGAAGETPEAAARRIADATRRAAEEKAARERQRAENAAAAAAEAARAAAAQEEARRLYEASERAKAEELAARLAVERKLAAERAQQRREEEARLAQEREAAARRERERREEEARRQREAELAAARAFAEERAALAAQRKVFLCRIEGRGAASQAPPGLKTEGAIPVKASVQLAAEATSLLAGTVGPLSRGAVGVQDAEELSIHLAGEVAAGMSQRQSGDYQLQASLDRGPLTLMDDVELGHWMHQLCMLTQVGAAAALRDTCRRLADDVATSSSRDFAVRLERGVLPKGHPQRCDAILDAVIEAIENDEGGAYPRTREALRTLVKDEEAAFYSAVTLEGGGPQPDAAPLLEISVAAHLVDRTVHNRPAKTMDAPAWYERTVDVARRWLDEVVATVEPDSLLDTAEVVATALGDEHPVAKHVAALAEANMSAATKQAILARQRAIQTEIAQQILQRGVPSREELAEARARDAEAAIPVVERVWALRNVAGSLALGGAGERRKAKEYLELALRLQRQHLGDEQHPGLLGELWRLTRVLVTNADWYPEARECMQEMMRIVEGVGQRYLASGDLASATALYEGTCAALEGLLDPMDPTLQRLSKQAENTFRALDDDEKAKVLGMRRKVNAIDKLADWYTEAPEIYADKAKATRIALWSAKQPLEPYCE